MARRKSFRPDSMDQLEVRLALSTVMSGAAAAAKPEAVLVSGFGSGKAHTDLEFTSGKAVEEFKAEHPNFKAEHPHIVLLSETAVAAKRDAHPGTATLPRYEAIHDAHKG